MENNYENAPQEETQSTQPAPQNEESTNSEYSNSNENMNQIISIHMEITNTSQMDTIIRMDRISIINRTKA